MACPVAFTDGGKQIELPSSFNTLICIICIFRCHLDPSEYTPRVFATRPMFPACVGGMTKRRKQWPVSVHRSTRLYCKDEAQKEEVKSTLIQLRASKDKWSQRGWTRAVNLTISDLSINTHGGLNNNGGNRNEEHKSEATAGIEIDQNTERHCVASILPRGCEVYAVELLRAALRDHGFIVLRSQVHAGEAQAARVAIDDQSRTTLLAKGCDDLVHHGVRGLSKVWPWKKWYKT